MLSVRFSPTLLPENGRAGFPPYASAASSYAGWLSAFSSVCVLQSCVVFFSYRRAQGLLLSLDRRDTMAVLQTDGQVPRNSSMAERMRTTSAGSNHCTFRTDRKNVSCRLAYLRELRLMSMRESARVWQPLLVATISR
jgi:hypothetical protein